MRFARQGKGPPISIVSGKILRLVFSRRISGISFRSSSFTNSARKVCSPPVRKTLASSTAALGGAALLVDGADLHRDLDRFERLAVHRDHQGDRLVVRAAVADEIGADDVVGVVLHDVA